MLHLSMPMVQSMGPSRTMEPTIRRAQSTAQSAMKIQSILCSTCVVTCVCATIVQWSIGEVESTVACVRSAERQSEMLFALISHKS